ncbi:M15 family metallopeptidase [Chitinibacter tainanensis]|uniref:M15 family metallopeptidase n=1 Tax=Chitinibacter tainanensis TaxID=230667 RepID=UPI000408CC1B|nr:M15 family metallopeptidase [Chitinibacter tainanensis]
MSSSLTPALAQLWQQLGIAPAVLQEKSLCIFAEASELVDVETATDGRVWQLTPAAAAAWLAMQAAAANAGIELRIASAYRASSRQVELIERKLALGQSIEDILQVLAPPGCSEHHTGRAIDIYSPGGPVVEEAFEDTAAFAWLQAHAGEFGFTLSFPRANPYGYVYEPWHWCYQSAAAG